MSVKMMRMREIDITKPVSGRIVITKSYWCCVAGDPTRALFYGTSPQCNQNEKIAQLSHDKLFKGEDVKVVYVETAYALQRT